MSLQNIKSWLNNPDKRYEDGLTLFNQHKRNNKHVDFLNSVDKAEQGSIHFNMLVTQVANIFRIIQQNPSLIQGKKIEVSQKKLPVNGDHKKSNKPRVVDNPLVDVKELPEDLQKKYFQNKQLLKDRTVLRNELEQVPEGEKHNVKRKVLAKKVLEISAQIDNTWNEIDAFTTKKKEAPKESKEADDRDQVKLAMKKNRRLENLKIYIPRERKKLGKDAKKDKAIKAKIEAYEKEKAELEKDLNG